MLYKYYCNDQKGKQSVIIIKIFALVALGRDHIYIDTVPNFYLNAFLFYDIALKNVNPHTHFPYMLVQLL